MVSEKLTFVSQRGQNEAAWRIASWRGALFLAAFILAGVAQPQSAHAFTFKVLYSFCAKTNCTDGALPAGGLVLDASGNLNGAASAGGAYGEGTVFRVDTSGGESLLYSFCAQNHCADGGEPSPGSLLTDAGGNLYGTTTFGGAHHHGTVFKLDANDNESVLYSFCGKSKCPDQVSASLITDGLGNLYATANYGGDNCSSPGCGMVLELTSNVATGKFSEKVLHTFCAKSGCADGAYPFAGVGLIADGAGDLYGTTYQGGNAADGGVAFELVPNATTGKFAERVLHSFCSETNCIDGTNPLAGLIIDGAGNLYGTNLGGCCYGLNEGTAFELKLNAATGKFKEDVLHTFQGGSDGGFPNASLIMDHLGNLYGTTTGVGGGSCQSGGGCGTVFELVLNAATGKYTENVLHNFCAETGCADGQAPMAGLIMDGAGNLFGTTYSGGNVGVYCQSQAQIGCGTVFELVND